MIRAKLMKIYLNLLRLCTEYPNRLFFPDTVYIPVSSVVGSWTDNGTLLMPVCQNLTNSSLILLDPGVKINEICYCSWLLPQQLLPVVREASGEFRNAAPLVTLVF